MQLHPVLCFLAAAIPFVTARSLQVSSLYDSTVRSQLASSPLRMELRASTNSGKIRAIITNQGVSTAYFSTWQNPLSQNEKERRVDVLDIKSEPVQFLNAEGLVGTLKFQVTSNYYHQEFL
jgi:hypothetical protein